MPTYAYACKNCGHRFDAVQSFAEPALTVCPECGADQLRKQYGSIGVTFNGSGFYRTDSRPGGSSGGEKSAATTSTSGGDSSSSASSAAPAATSASGS